MNLNIFIDTEFTNLLNPRLLSLALVAESGEEFYAELPYDMKDCSEFVREVVIPLLTNDPSVRLSNDEAFVRLNDWLRLVKPRGGGLVICYDSGVDWNLFNEVLQGQVPAWCTPRLIDDCIGELLRFDYHTRTGLPEHHALNDARANCYAFRERVAS